MGKFLVHHEGKFLEWSTIPDAPVTYGMSEDELRKYIKGEYGQQGLRDIDDRMARAREFGTSCRAPRYSFDDIVEGNRAGPDESELTKAELIDRYFVNPPDQ